MNLQQINRKHNLIKGLVVVLVLFVLVLTPILASADILPDFHYDSYHGKLEISAQNNISFSLSNKKIDTSQVVEKAKPTEVHTGGVGTFHDVKTAYYITNEDLEELNKATNVNETVNITLHGRYIFYCKNNSCKKDYTIGGEEAITVSFTALDPYTVTFVGNGGKVDGKNQQAVKITADDKAGIAVGSAKMPKKMTRKDYDFKGWSTSQNTYKAFTKDSLVTGDITVYAFWEPVAVDKPVGKKEEKVVDVKEHFATSTRYYIVLSDQNIPLEQNIVPVEEGPVDNSSSSQKASYTKAELISLAQEQNIPIATIGNGSVPLFAPEGASGWAFINLLLAVIGAAMAVTCFVISARQGRNKRSIWFILSAVSGIAGLVFFFITENIKQNMVLTDNWTVISSVIFMVSIVSVIIYLRKKEDIEEYIYNY